MKTILAFVVFLLVIPAHAEIASTVYVDEATSTKVDLSENANQELEGSYTVSGTLHVPTPDLPSAE